jgi:hypothetical protein
MKITFGNMTVELNIFDISKQPLEYDEVKSVYLIEETVDESSIEDPLEACFAQFGEDWIWRSYLSKMMLFWSLLHW